jgi:hypothetical protein
MLPGVVLAIVAAVSAVPQVPTDVIREQAERELALVRHLHRHVLEPSDGLALAADRRDLQRRGPGAPAGAPLPAGASDVELLGQLTVLTDLWYARVIGRTPFHLMPPGQIAGIADAQRAIGALLSRTDPKARDRFLPDVQAEIETLARLMSGHADISEADIDLALTIADQAAAGQPLSTYGIRPTGAPYGAGPPVTYSQSAPPTAAYATSSPTGCQTLRLSASTSASSAGMLRAVECWTSMQAWPGWVAQVVESLDWAETYAKVDRDCSTLADVLDRVKEFGRPLAPGVRPEDLSTLADRAEMDRRQLRTANRCR